jgi:adenylosuccinate lyase
LKDGSLTENNLLDRLAGDSRLNLSRERLNELFKAGEAKTGAATSQVNAIARTAEAWLAKYPAAAGIKPGEIL